MNDIINTYSRAQTGGEMQYYIGKQYGSGWLRTLGRIAFPLLKSFGRAAVNTARDVFMRDKEVVPSIKTNALNEVNKFFPSVAKEFAGEGKKKTINNPKKRKRFQLYKR